MLPLPERSSYRRTLGTLTRTRQVGVNRHPWSTPRSSRAPTPRASTSTPTPAYHTSIQIVTPPTPKRPAEFDRVLLSTENVVRVQIKSNEGVRHTYNAYMRSLMRSAPESQTPETTGRNETDRGSSSQEEAREQRVGGIAKRMLSNGAVRLR